MFSIYKSELWRKHKKLRSLPMTFYDKTCNQLMFYFIPTEAVVINYYCLNRNSEKTYCFQFSKIFLSFQNSPQFHILE